jgi:predicted RNase H-like HicB family nuclease
MSAQYFPAIVEAGTEGYGVFFPDLPGCTSAGGTVEQAARNAEEALRGHIALMIRDGDEIPTQRPIDQIERDPDVTEVARILVRVDVPGKFVRPNITMEEGLLARVDAAAVAQGMSRSGFLAEAARRMLGA